MQSELTTAAFTLIGAVTFLIVSEFLRGLFIAPMLKLRALIGEIVDRVIYYSAELTSGASIDEARRDKIHEELRSLSTQLRAYQQMISKYKFWEKIKLVPSSEAIDKCAKNLTGMSNSFRGEWRPHPTVRVDVPESEPKLSVKNWYSADGEANVKRIIKLQDALKLTVKIIPEEPHDS